MISFRCLSSFSILSGPGVTIGNPLNFFRFEFTDCNELLRRRETIATPQHPINSFLQLPAFLHTSTLVSSNWKLAQSGPLPGVGRIPSKISTKTAKYSSKLLFLFKILTSEQRWKSFLLNNFIIQVQNLILERGFSTYFANFVKMCENLYFRRGICGGDLALILLLLIPFSNSQIIGSRYVFLSICRVSLTKLVQFFN